MTTETIPLVDDETLEALFTDADHPRWENLTRQEHDYVREQLETVLMSLGQAVERLRTVRETFET